MREDTKITDISELDAYLEKFTVIGGGGTDFRPAFSYVAGLREQGELRGLRGLLYLPMERARIRQNDRNTMSHLFT